MHLRTSIHIARLRLPNFLPTLYSLHTCMTQPILLFFGGFFVPCICNQNATVFLFVLTLQRLELLGPRLLWKTIFLVTIPKCTPVPKPLEEFCMHFDQVKSLSFAPHCFAQHLSSLKTLGEHLSRSHLTLARQSIALLLLPSQAGEG